MPNNAGVLRQYLVKLGFKVDKQSYKDFNLALEKVAAGFVAVAKASAAAATAVAADVAVMAVKFEKLYYASQRARTSAANLKAFGNAAAQIGLNAEEAQAAVENMQQAIRLNPGLRGLLQALQVNPDQKDGVKLMMDLIDRVSQMPFYQGSRIASQFGIDDKTLLQIEQNRAALQRFFEQQQKVQASMNEASIQGTVFMQSLRGVEQATEGLATTMAVKLLPYLTLAAEFWRQQITDLGLLINKQGLYNAFLIKSLEFLKAIGLAGDRGDAFAHSGSGKTPVKRTPNRWLNPGAAVPRSGGVTVTTGGNTGIPLHNPGNLRTWGNTPLGVIPGAHGTFANFGTDFEGLSAMAGNLIRYFQEGMNTIGAIVSKWAPSADNNNTQAYIANVAKRLGVGANSTLDLMNPAVLDRLMDAMIRQEQGGKQPFSQSFLDSAVRYRLSQPSFGAGGPVSIDQKTQITVQGAGDPGAVGKAVAGEQSRVNGDMVRNMTGVLQ